MERIVRLPDFDGNTHRKSGYFLCYRGETLGKIELSGQDHLPDFLPLLFCGSDEKF